jgi:hypothetical protein
VHALPDVVGELAGVVELQRLAVAVGQLEVLQAGDDLRRVIERAVARGTDFERNDTSST